MSSGLLQDSTTGRTATQKATSNAAWVMVKSSDLTAYPAGATALTTSSGNVANGSAAAALAAGGAGTTNYVTGFTITGAGATAASVVSATLAGVIGGTMTFTVAVPAGVTTAITPLLVDFGTPVPASTTNTAITLTLPALGAGNTNASVTIRGFRI